MLWNYVLPLAYQDGPTIEKAAAKVVETTTAPADWSGTWALLAKLAIAVAIVVLSYVAGRWLSRRWRMPDHGWKIGLVCFAVLAGLVIAIPAVIPDKEAKYLFSVDAGPESDLKASRISGSLREEFEKNNETLPEKPSVSVVEAGREWQIDAGGKAYLVRKVAKTLEVYDKAGKTSIGLKLGIDLRGGAVLVLGITPEDQKANKEVTDELLDAIRRRVDPSGTKQITVRKTGNYQIEVIIPDVEQAELDDLEKRLTTLGTLEFRILAHKRTDKPANIEGWMRKAVQLPPDKKEVVNASGDRVVYWVPMEEKVVKDFPHLTPGNEGIINADKTAFLNDQGFCTRRIARPRGQPDRIEILVIDDPYDVDGGFLTQVNPNIGQEGYVVEFNFDAKGSGRFSALTTQYQPVGDFRYRLGIVLNGYLTSAPTIRSVISSSGQITGYQGPEGKKERDGVISVLKSGRLPAQLESLSADPTSPTLGAHNVRRGLIAMSVSMGLVLVFMLFYYRFAGVVACLALLTNLVLILAAMVAIKAALTLPGLAGLVLTVGMSVDANVLIFERIREEIHRGATMRMAIRNGFGKAMSTIVDANLTTLITAIVLYGIGTTEIKGFSVTLILGIGMSMFTAIFCSRLIFDIAEKRHWITRIKMMQILSATNIDFLGKRRLAGAFSVLVILVGIGAVVARAREGNLLDIDFTGGSSVHVMFVKDAKDDRGRPIASRWIETELETWDDEVAKASREELIEKLGEDLTRRLQLKLARELVLSDDSKAPLPQERIDRITEKLDSGEALSDADKKGLDNVIAGDRFRQFRRIAILDVETAPRRGGEDELRFQIDSPNGFTAGVEGILTRLFGDSLLSNAMVSSAPEEKPEKTGEKKPGEKPAGEKKAGKEPEKVDPKAEPKKTMENKEGKEKKSKEEKKTTTGALRRDDGPFFVALPTPAMRAAAVLAQADDSDKKTDEKETDETKKDGKAKGVTRSVSFRGIISHDKLEEVLRQAVARTFPSRQVSVRVTSTAYETEPEYYTTAQTWTVILGVESEAEADAVLAAADKIIQSEPLFPSTRSVGDQVSGQMRTAGIVAILAALVGIVIYIWIRFQKIFFGLAAVVALVHDVAITLGMIAISGYLVDIPFMEAFKIPFMEAFKISLPIVAAFLTIIGYSLNDTIVVFDRIREVKGKNPILTQEMVNRSINGTLSRTLLTSITTLGVVAILFFFGGQGMLHAFSFALVVGVLVGTYSSIFVASPALLWLTQRFGQGGSVTVPARASSKAQAEPVGA